MSNVNPNSKLWDGTNLNQNNEYKDNIKYRKLRSGQRSGLMGAKDISKKVKSAWKREG